MTQDFKPSNPDYATTVRAGFEGQSLMALYGARLTDVAPGRVTIELAPDGRLLQQAGHIHGGVLGALADSAGGFAALTLMPAGSDVVTIEYKINFMRAARGPLRAVGEVIRPGKTISVTRMTCTCEIGGIWETCAIVQATFMRVGGASGPADA